MVASSSVIYGRFPADRRSWLRFKDHEHYAGTCVSTGSILPPYTTHSSGQSIVSYLHLPLDLRRRLIMFSPTG